MAIEQVVQQNQQGAISGQEKQEVQKQETTEVQQTTGQEKVVPKEDLISRVSKVKVDVKKETTQETNSFGLTKEDYDKVQNDPTLSKFYKSMQSDYIRKTQETAELRKQAEEKIKQSSNWTPERLAQEINKPDFIQAAQQVYAVQNPPNSGLTNEEYSALTEKEKAQLKQANQRINALEMQNWQMQQRQQDEQLKTKYANYAPDIVDTTINHLVRGEVKANREYVWKAIDYEDAVQRAYELGKQDRQLETKEKQQSTSIEGFNATPQGEVLKPIAGESNRDYFKRIAQGRLNEQQGLRK